MLARTATRISTALTLLALLALPSACTDDADDTGNDETGGNSGDGDGDGGDGDGITDCTPPGVTDPVECAAGQYCSDPVLAICENGCLSNANCLSDQTCEKDSGQDVGSCQNKAGDGPTEEEFCDKLLTCDPSGTEAQCSMVYAATNQTCHECIVDGNCGDINDGSCDSACGL